MYYCQRKPKNRKKRGSPGNEANDIPQLSTSIIVNLLYWVVGGIGSKLLQDFKCVFVCVYVTDVGCSTNPNALGSCQSKQTINFGLPNILFMFC